MSGAGLPSDAVATYKNAQKSYKLYKQGNQAGAAVYGAVVGLTIALEASQLPADIRPKSLSRVFSDWTEIPTPERTAAVKKSDELLRRFPEWEPTDRAFQEALQRGLRVERKALGRLGLSRNTARYKTPDISGKKYVIPDAVTKNKLVEIKSVDYLSNTKQIRGLKKSAQEEGKTLEIVVGKSTTVADTVTEGKADVEIRRMKGVKPEAD